MRRSKPGGDLTNPPLDFFDLSNKSVGVFRLSVIFLYDFFDASIISLF